MSPAAALELADGAADYTSRCRAAAPVGPRLQSRCQTLLSQPGRRVRGVVWRRLWSRGLTSGAGAAPCVGPRLQSRRPTFLSQPGSRRRGVVRRRLWSRGLTSGAGAAAPVGLRLQSRRPTLLSQPGRRGKRIQAASAAPESRHSLFISSTFAILPPSPPPPSLAFPWPAPARCGPSSPGRKPGS
jgi:hypothetical protein